MRWWLALVVASSGCHGPTVFECLASTDCHDGAMTGTCEPTGFCSFADTGCASGRRYDTTAGMDLAGTCVPGAPDQDGDTIADSMDNCPTKPNTNQDNEDSDRFGDVCDPCPMFADGQPVADLDGDGVSDGCDPHTDALAPDQILEFEGFGEGLPATWTSSLWAASGGAVHAIGDGTVTGPVPAATADSYVLARLDLSSLGVGSGAVGVGLDGIECIVEESAPSVGQKIALHTTGGGDFSSTNYTFSPGTTYIFTLHWDHATAWDCSVTELGGTPAITTGTHAPVGGPIGVAGKGDLVGDFTSLMVVGR